MNFHRSCLAAVLFATMIAVGSASANCSNASTNGAYGFLVLGSAYGEPGTAVGQLNFDGAGNVSGTQTTSFYGSIYYSPPFTGTYSIARDCTGTMLAGGSVFNFVLDKDRKGAQVIYAIPGVVYPGSAVAQGPATCGLPGKKRKFAANLSGTIVGVGAVAIVGQVRLDGNGNITGGGTFSVTGTISSGSISGTYTENADCTGTAQITPEGLSTMNLNTVVVDGGRELLMIETDSGTVVSGTLQQ